MYCNFNNDLIASVMQDKNNSYNQKSAEPLISISLTPQNIMDIQEYNATTTYDGFNLTCEKGSNRNYCVGQ